MPEPEVIDPEEVKKERLEMLRALNPARALAFYRRYRLAGPTEYAKVLVRMHKERIADPDMTDKEKKLSQDWIDQRIYNGRSGPAMTR